MVVFFDIDGTIIDEKTQEIPPSAVRAVARLAENGHMPVINTGRPYSHIDPRVKAMAFRGYVCGCGMEVRLGDRWLYRKKPDSALCAYVAEAVRKFDILPLYEGDDGTVMYEPDCWELPFIREELDRMRKKGFRVYPRQEHPDFMKFISFSRSETAQQGFCQAMAPTLRSSIGAATISRNTCSRAAPRRAGCWRCWKRWGCRSVKPWPSATAPTICPCSALRPTPSAWAAAWKR